jgi:O-antigen ligase
MARIVEVSLIVGMVLAVLAFGGTEPSIFSIVQVLFFGVAVLLVATPKSPALSISRRALVIPAVLASVALLQLCPLPADLLQRFAGRGNPLAGEHVAYLSLQPYSTRTHFLILLTCLVAFFLAQIVCQDRNRQQRLIVSLVALGTFEAFYGLVQYLSGWQQVFTYVKKFDLEEATGTYINRNHYAGFLEMILPFSLALVFYEYGKLRGNEGQPFSPARKLITHASLQRLVLWFSIAVVLFAAIIFSRSRMGIIAATASLLVVFGLAGAARFQGKTGLVLTATFLLLSICLAVWIGPGPIVERFENVGQEYMIHEESRMSIWRDAGALIRDHPWLGTGLGTFPVAYTAVQTTFLGRFVNHAHNDYLEVASDLGVPAALALFVSILFVLARAVWNFLSRERNFERIVALGCAGSIVAMLLHSLADFNLYIPANALLFSLVLGLAVSTERQTSRPRSEEPGT